jgi:hypothetical protein
VLRTKERAPTPLPSVEVTFGFVVESIKELGGASKLNKYKDVCIFFATKKRPKFLY